MVWNLIDLPLDLFPFLKLYLSPIDFRSFIQSCHGLDEIQYKHRCIELNKTASQIYVGLNYEGPLNISNERLEELVHSLVRRINPSKNLGLLLHIQQDSNLINLTRQEKVYCSQLIVALDCLEPSFIILQIADRLHCEFINKLNIIVMKCLFPFVAFTTFINKLETLIYVGVNFASVIEGEEETIREIPKYPSSLKSLLICTNSIPVKLTACGVLGLECLSLKAFRGKANFLIDFPLSFIPCVMISNWNPPDGKTLDFLSNQKEIKFRDCSHRLEIPANACIGKIYFQNCDNIFLNGNLNCTVLFFDCPHIQLTCKGNIDSVCFLNCSSITFHHQSGTINKLIIHNTETINYFPSNTPPIPSIIRLGKDQKITCPSLEASVVELIRNL